MRHFDLRFAAPHHVALVWAFSTLASGVVVAQTSTRAPADFNADGFADLAVGVPNESVTCTRFFNYASAGVVHVVYGKSTPRVSAPRAFANQLLSQPCGKKTQAGISNARFGSALAYGDFNGDGFDDLAVGVPNTGSLTGKVAIYKGSPAGLTLATTLTKATIAGANAVSCLNFNNDGSTSPAPDLLGLALATGDVNRDGYVDLAIASSCVSGISGAIHVVPGAPQGLAPSSSATQNHFLSNTVPASLAFGDFDQNGYPDLAIGAPVDFSWWYSYSALGHVLVQYGSVAGLSSTPQHLSSALAGLPQSQPASNDDRFGQSLATADFNADGYVDLAIGVPGKNSGAGLVHVLFGSANRLTTTGAVTWSQGPLSNDFPEAGDRVGTSLAVGNFDNDLFPELVIGAPGEDQNQGSVHVVTLTSGPTPVGEQRWRQGTDGIINTREINDSFGAALTATDLDGDGRSDLAIAAPGEDQRSGLINLIFGSSSGLAASGNWMLKQGFDGLPEASERSDEFGSF